MIKAVIAVAGFLLTAAQQELLVQTDLGPVQGHYNELGVREWSGIPYAKPPVGELRWEYPQSPEPWTSTYEANFQPPGCQQTCKLPPGNCPEHGQSEDCLYMTVMAPTKPSPDPEGYPVFFWIHGGAFEQGLGTCALYNGSTFAQKDVVTVVINYRLGSFGFMAAEVMQGNYGFMDQRLALQWTQRNIAAFGGNPKRVTVGGQSAGGMSTACHMTSPGSKGLFSQAIPESNPLGLPYHSRDTAKANADAVFEYVGCPINDVACMRTKSAEEILEAQNEAPSLNFDNLFINFLPWSPLVEEGGEIPQQPLYALMNGEIQQVPVLSGTVFDEGQLFVYELFTKPLNKAAYEAIVLAVFGARNYPEIIRKYPYNVVEGSEDGRQAFNVLATDLLFYCPLRNVTRGYQRSLGVSAMPTYVYAFKHIMSFDCWGPGYEFCVGWCCHGSELPFVFNVFTDGVDVTYEPTSEEVQLTEDVSNMWANFIVNSNPNKGLTIPTTFPLYTGAQDEIIIIDEPGTTTEDHRRDEYCDMWDRMGFFY